MYTVHVYTCMNINNYFVFIMHTHLFRQHAGSGATQSVDHMLFDHGQGTRQVLLEPGQVELGLLVVEL